MRAKPSAGSRSYCPFATLLIRSVALLNLCMSVHAPEFSASTISRLRSSVSCGMASSCVPSFTCLQGTGIKKSPPPSLYHMVASAERSTQEMAPTQESAGRVMVRRCRGTLAPMNSRSHSSSSSHSRNGLSSASSVASFESSSRISAGGSFQLREPGLLTPQCRISLSARSVMKSTRMGSVSSFWRTTTSISLLLPRPYLRRHLVLGSMAHLASKKSSGISLFWLLPSDSTGAWPWGFTRSSGFRLGAPSGLPTSEGAAGGACLASCCCGACCSGCGLPSSFFQVGSRFISLASCS
mmetsp:Transcript_19626/g.54711  ORF Transcript_19626/g.54711 Transcript_19626/m.54711 type:complete len:296 (-) Transcript_19626:1137-2024(-)